MAGADIMALPEGAIDEVAARVGSCLRGEHDGTGLRIGIACALFNGGISVRLALYSANSAMRATGAPLSKTAAIYSGA